MKYEVAYDIFINPYSISLEQLGQPSLLFALDVFCIEYIWI